MSLLEDFMDSVAGAEKSPLDFDSVISSRGDFLKLSNINVILKSWSNILITPIRSYDQDPEYGSKLYFYIFEPLDKKTQNEIKKEIVYTLNKYDNRAKIRSIEVSTLPNRKGFSVSIQADYNGQTDTVVVNIDERLYAP